MLSKLFLIYTFISVTTQIMYMPADDDISTPRIESVVGSAKKINYHRKKICLLKPSDLMCYSKNDVPGDKEEVLNTFDVVKVFDYDGYNKINDHPKPEKLYNKHIPTQTKENIPKFKNIITGKLEHETSMQNVDITNLNNIENLKNIELGDQQNNDNGEQGTKEGDDDDIKEMNERIEIGDRNPRAEVDSISSESQDSADLDDKGSLHINNNQVEGSEEGSEERSEEGSEEYDLVPNEDNKNGEDINKDTNKMHKGKLTLYQDRNKIAKSKLSGDYKFFGDEFYKNLELDDDDDDDFHSLENEEHFRDFKSDVEVLDNYNFDKDYETDSDELSNER